MGRLFYSCFSHSKKNVLIPITTVHKSLFSEKKVEISIGPSIRGGMVGGRAVFVGEFCFDQKLNESSTSPRLSLRPKMARSSWVSRT